MHPQRGFILIERMLVAGVMAVVILGIVGWLAMASSRGHARDYAQATGQLIQAVETGMGSAQSYHGLTIGEALNRGFVPTAFLNGAQANTAWGALTLAPAGARHEGFEIRFARVPDEECADFVQAVAAGMLEIRVNDQVVVSGRQLDVPAMAAACADGGEVSLVRMESGFGIKAGWETW